MAIDLCNKQERMRIVGDQATLVSQFGDALDNVSVPLNALSVDQREVVELAYYSALSHPNPLMHVVGDPAAWASDFGHALDRVAVRLDQRPSEELRRQALDHPDPVMREQALFEYADRDHDDAVELLEQAVAQRPGPAGAVGRAVGHREAGRHRAPCQALRRFEQRCRPRDRRVGGLFISELQTGDPAFDERDRRYTPGRTFDETIFLLIHCDLYIRLDTPTSAGARSRWPPRGWRASTARPTPARTSRPASGSW